MSASVHNKLDKFFSNYKLIPFASKEIIKRPAESIEHIYYLKKGFVRQYTISKNGEEVALHVFGAGAYLPMMVLLNNEANSYYFESMGDVEAYKAPAGDVLKFVQSDPEVAFDLAQRFSAGLCRLLNKVEETFFKDSYERIISILFFLAEKLGKKDGNLVSIDVPLTHGEIASWVGIQRETASRQLELLVSKGVISSKNHIFTINMEKLLNERDERKL
jgi:CRP/FNR family transcriptional regulator